MKYLVMVIAILSVTKAYSGAEGHGGDHVRSRIIWANYLAMSYLKSESCTKAFDEPNCQKMEAKLKSSPLEFYSGSQPLKALVNGKMETVTARTQPTLGQKIEFDVNRAKNATLPELVVLNVHEAGHAVGLSMDYTTDRLVIEGISSDAYFVSLLSTADYRSEPELIVDYSKHDDYDEWCTDVAGILELGLTNGRRARTYREELIIIEDAIQSVFSISNRKQHKFLMATLESVRLDLLVFSTEEEMAFYLRRGVEAAVRDFQYLDQHRRNVDNGPYVTIVLERGLYWGTQVRQTTQELVVLSSSAARGIYWLDQSWSRRTEGYACAQKTLNNALQLSSNPALSLRGRVEVLRAAHYEANRYIKGELQCR
jgi:hypothetical protein